MKRQWITIPLGLLGLWYFFKTEETEAAEAKEVVAPAPIEVPVVATGPDVSGVPDLQVAKVNTPIHTPAFDDRIPETVVEVKDVEIPVTTAIPVPSPIFTSSFGRGVLNTSSGSGPWERLLYMLYLKPSGEASPIQKLLSVLLKKPISVLPSPLKSPCSQRVMSL